MANSNPYQFVVENLDDIIVYSQSLEVWNPEYSVPGVAGKEAVRERVLRRKCYFLLLIRDQQGCDSDGSREDQVSCGLGSAEEGESRQQW
jgi:hypothetical protein